MLQWLPWLGPGLSSLSLDIALYLYWMPQLFFAESFLEGIDERTEAELLHAIYDLDQGLIG